jgi:hypothetical protein
MGERVIEKNWETIEEMMNDWCSEMIGIILLSLSSIRMAETRCRKDLTTMTGYLTSAGDAQSLFSAAPMRKNSPEKESHQYKIPGTHSIPAQGTHCGFPEKSNRFTRVDRKPIESGAFV